MKTSYAEYIPSAQEHQRTTSAEAGKPKPDASGFRPGSDEQLRRLARSRPYGLDGLRWAQARGVLVFNSSWHDHDVYGVTDQTGLMLELRRIDGQTFPAFQTLKERKSHAVKWSKKNWPLGIVESLTYPAIALCEGVPDFLEAHDRLLFEQAPHHTNFTVHCSPVAMLSASASIADEALQYFRGKVVRILAHADPDGLGAAERWQNQIIAADAAQVDIFNLRGLKQEFGKEVNDLYDLRNLSLKEYFADPKLFRILP